MQKIFARPVLSGRKAKAGITISKPGNWGELAPMSLPRLNRGSVKLELSYVLISKCLTTLPSRPYSLLPATRPLCTFSFPESISSLKGWQTEEISQIEGKRDKKREQSTDGTHIAISSSLLSMCPA
jgi:hypothetical protein